MSNDPRIIVQRRSLQAGYIAFRQRGHRVEWTQDNIKWRLAFVLPDCGAAAALSEIQELVNVYGPNIPVEPVVIDQTTPGDVMKSLQHCGIARALVAIFDDLVREVIDNREDESWNFKAALLAFISGVGGLLAILGSGGLAIIPIASGLGVYMGAGAAAAAGYVGLQAFTNVPRTLTPEETEDLVCCVKEALDTEFSRASLSTITCANIPEEYLSAWNEVMARPEMWAGVVQASQEQMYHTGYSGCCGDECIYIAPASATNLYENTEKDGFSLRTNDTNPPDSLIAKFKTLKAQYSFDPVQAKSISVDIFAVAPFSQLGGNAVVKFYPYSAQGPVSSPDKTVVAGRQTITAAVNNPGNYNVTGLTIEIVIAYANNQSANISKWYAAEAWLNAIKICPEEPIEP